ncbi:MAG: sigma-70 family RNA polymerase sigma factor [Acidimicrobiales bacterium]
MSDPRRARFEALAADVYEPLQRYVRRRIDASAVDDVVADTLFVCWRRLDEIPTDATVAWTLGVARRCLANDRRGARRQAAVGERLAAQPQQSTTPVEPDVDLRDAVAELPETDREVVLLWAWEGMAPREIAVVTGLTPNAVSLRLHRAKQRLAVRLETNDTSVSRQEPPGIGHDAGEHEPRTEQEER